MRRRLCALALIVFCLLDPSFVGAATAPQFGRGDWQKLIAAHKGHPVIVHFWAQTCGPCLAELKHWGAVHRDYPKVDLVLVQSDPLPDRDDASEKLLRDAGLTGVESWVLADLFDEKMRAEVDPNWNAELPLTVMVDRHQKASKLIGESDFKIVQNWIKRID